MKISEIFYSIQGEIDVGKPVIFIRFSGCNLIKNGKGCKFCDSLYAENGEEMSLNQIIKEIKKYPCKNIVITGGEPLSHKKELRELVEELRFLEYRIDVETNGTIFDLVFLNVNHINCSPKKQAIDTKVLGLLKSYNTRYKFVYESKNQLWWEPIIYELELEPNRIWIMPEGKTPEEQNIKTIEVIEYCKKMGFNFSPRQHILTYGSRRGV